MMAEKSAQIGHTLWVIPEGYIPTGPEETDRRFVSHETACILNCGDRDVTVRITLYFVDREPVGPYTVQVPALCRGLTIALMSLLLVCPCRRRPEHAFAHPLARHLCNYTGQASPVAGRTAVMCDRRAASVLC
jgi:hypothetical protein